MQLDVIHISNHPIEQSVTIDTFVTHILLEHVSIKKVFQLYNITNISKNMGGQ